MRRSTLTSLLVLCLVTAAPAWAQPSPGELTVVLSSLSTEALDPILAGHIVKFYLSLMFDYLVGATPDGQLSRDGGVATRWEASADGKRWTFHLRRGVRFHTGDELTAEDVKFSILRALGPRSTTGYAQGLRQLVKEIETPAPDRVVIVTKDTTAMIPTLLSRLLSTEGMILPKQYVEAKGDDGFARAPVGSGPYRFVEQVSGSHVRLEAVPSHWRLGTPKYKTVVFKAVPEETTRIAMLRRGEADVVEISRERMKEVAGAGYPVHLRREDGQIEGWFVQPWAQTPIRDKRVREALNLAIDRKELAETVFGGQASPAAVPFGLSWSFPEIKFKITPEMVYAHDPGRAKRLLADAGYANGFPIDIFAFQLPGFPEGRAMAEAIAGYWQHVGLKPRLIPVDYPAFRKQWFDRTAPGALGYYNIANRDWIGTYALIDKYAAPTAKSASIRDPELDSLMDAVIHQADREKTYALMRSIFNRLRSEHLGLPIVYYHTPYATSKRVPRWNPGAIMYELNVDELLAGK